MTDLSLHILDIANNSTRANAKTVRIEVAADTKSDVLTVKIDDDGDGIDKELLDRVSDPFGTTRITRRVGMGIPLFKMAAEQAGGAFKIDSVKGEGTGVFASFKISHIDRPPMGEIAETVITLIGGAKDTDFYLYYEVDGRVYEFDTKEVKSVLGEYDLTDAGILNYLKEMINENIVKTNGGTVL